MKISRRKLKCEVPSVAMGDIAFNLLIFILILARSQDDSHLRWDPARASKIEKVASFRASVTVDVKNNVYLNGRHLSVTQLADGLEKILGESPAGKRTVLLKIHKETLASTFEPILEAVSQAGGEIVHVLEQDKK